jgi:hypothetical protein
MLHLTINAGRLRELSRDEFADDDITRLTKPRIWALQQNPQLEEDSPTPFARLRFGAPWTRSLRTANREEEPVLCR